MTAAIVAIVATAALAGAAVGAEDPSQLNKDDPAQFQAMKSPVPYGERSIARGKVIYARMCTECHGLDGKAQIDVVANATNLTNPEKYLHGSTEGEIFRSIRDGAGIDMPPYKTQIRNEEDLWHLVNFVRSLWPEDKRPKPQTDEGKTDTKADEDGASSGGPDHEPEQEQ